MMDAKAILDQLLNSGKELAANTRDFAEKKLGVPEQGAERDSMLSGLGKGAVAGGLLALLLGTRTGRSVTGKAIKYGSLAAVAGIAYKTYQSWKASQAGTEMAANDSSDRSISDLEGDQANQRGLVLIRAMIAAANADGHIDEAERANIREQLRGMGMEQSSVGLLQQEIDRPLTPIELAGQIDSQAAASEVFLLSTIIVDEANPMEREYLKELASALRLPTALVDRLRVSA